MISYDDWSEMFEAMCAATKTRDYGALGKSYYRSFEGMREPPSAAELLEVYSALIDDIGAKLPNANEIKQAIHGLRARNRPALPQAKGSRLKNRRLYQAVVSFLIRGDCEWVRGLCNGHLAGDQESVQGTATVFPHLLGREPVEFWQVEAIANLLELQFGLEALKREFEERRDVNGVLLAASDRSGNVAIYEAIEHEIKSICGRTHGNAP